MPAADRAGTDHSDHEVLLTTGVMGRRAAPARVRSVLMTADAVGGVWRYAIDLGAALTVRGVQTTLAVMGPAPDRAQLREAAQSNLSVVYRPYRLEWMDDPWADVEEAGRWLLALEERLRPAVIHVNGYAHAALPWSAPVVIVAHSCVRSWWRAVRHEGAPDRLNAYSDRVRLGLAAARLVIAPTAAMLRVLHEEYGVQSPAQVIANGVVSSASPDEPLWDAKEPFVLAAGRVWDEAKNLAAVCRAASAWPWPVYVAGDQQSPGGQCGDLCGVHALGRIASGVLGSWQRRASIFVSPARYEPFGLSILEAARAGCALVLGKIPSLEENWDAAARFVPPDDGDALARAVRDLIADRVQRRAMARQAWKRAGRFTVDRCADAYLGAYEAVAS